MKRALVTGAGGFVGANLARRLLADGHHVCLLLGADTDRWRVAGLDAESIAIDLVDPAAVDGLLERVRPDWVFHLAAHGAYSWQTDVRRIAAVNVVGTANLLESASALGFEAFVNAGTSSEYGAKNSAAREEDAIDPNSAYAVTKAAATMLLRHASLARDLPITTLRLYSAYGPWEDPRRLVPALVRNGLEGRLPPLVDPHTPRDFVFVDDVCEAFVRAASTRLRPGTILNVASGTQTTVGEAVEIAREVLSIAQEPEWGSYAQRSWDTNIWFGDPSAALRSLGWHATTDFEAGFRLTVEWARREGWR